MQLDTLLRGGG